MTTAYSSLLGLALPVTGELSGTWGDTVNDYITKYVDAAVAGVQTISGNQTAVTLSITNGIALTSAGAGATGSAQYAIINCTGNPAGLLTVTAPASSKAYIVINSTSTSQSVKVVGAGPTTGVTMVSGEKAVIAWNGSDFVKVASTVITNLTGTLGIANGGTGQTTIPARSVFVANALDTLTTVTPAAGQSIRINAGNTAWEAYTPSTGSGDVAGPASATDNAIARFDGTTGKLIQNSAVTIDDTTGSLNFTGTGARITGDFSNATIANRVMFQTSTVNGVTNVYAIPNGTGTTSTWTSVNNSDPTNAGVFQLAATPTDARLTSNITGTGTYLPMTFYTNGSERVRIDTSGNVSVGGTAARGTTAGSAAVQLFNGTAPAGTLTNGVSLYSSSGDLNFMDSAGNGFKVGYRNIPAVGTKTGSYSLGTGDVGKYVQVSTGGSITVPNSTFAEGDVITIFNNTTGNITMTMSITTAYIAGTNADKDTLTLATRGVATILFISGTVCVVSGNVS